MRNRFWIAISALALCGLGISACGGGATPAGASITEPQEPETATVAVPAEDPDPADAPAQDADDDSARADASAGGACTQVPRDLPLAEQCAMAGAEVHRFPNTCVGRCRAMESEGMMCGQAMTPGCKCPDGQCIDDRTGCCRELMK